MSLQLVWQGRIEIFRNLEKPPILSQDTAGLRLDWNESRNRLPCTSDDDLLTLGYPHQQLGQMGLGFVDVDLSHAIIVD